MEKFLADKKKVCNQKKSFLYDNIVYDVSQNIVIEGDVCQSLKTICIVQIAVLMWKNYFNKIIAVLYRINSSKTLVWKSEPNNLVKILIKYRGIILKGVKNFLIPVSLRYEIIDVCENILENLIRFYFTLWSSDTYRSTIKYCLQSLSYTKMGSINHKRTYETLIKKISKKKRNKIENLFKINEKSKTDAFRLNDKLAFFNSLTDVNPMIIQQFWNQVLNVKEKDEILNNIEKYWDFKDKTIIFYLLSKMQPNHLFKKCPKYSFQCVIIIEKLEKLCRSNYSDNFVATAILDRIKPLLFTHLNLFDGIKVVMKFLNKGEISAKLFLEIWRLFEHCYKCEIESNLRFACIEILKNCNRQYKNLDFFKTNVLDPKWIMQFRELLYDEKFGIGFCTALVIKNDSWYENLIEIVFESNANEFRDYLFKKKGKHLIEYFENSKETIKAYQKFCLYFQNNLAVTDLKM